MLFYNEWRKAIAALPIEQRCEVYEALFRYAFEKVVPDDALIAALTHIMRIRIDQDQESYEARCAQNKINGAMGGRPRKEQNSKDTEVATSDTLHTSQQKNRTVIFGYDSVSVGSVKKPNGYFGKPNKTERKPKKTDTEPNVTEHNPIMIYDKCKMINDIVDDDNSGDRDFLNRFMSDRITVEQFCKNQKISLAEFEEYANEILTDWKLGQVKHDNETDKRQHLINTLRIKISSKRKENATTSVNRSGDAVIEQRRNNFARYIADKLSRPDTEEPDISGNY